MYFLTMNMQMGFLGKSSWTHLTLKGAFVFRGMFCVNMVFYRDLAIGGLISTMGTFVYNTARVAIFAIILCACTGH